jgi:serine/threonine protein kinase/Tol biopolymer transport system component
LEIFLEKIGQENPELRNKVESMLRDHGQLADFLLTPALGERVPNPHSLENLAGTSIGPYQLIRVIGEGGVGIVYLATQTKPLKRQVALKILKAGTNSAEILSRFEAERHTLALMNHPGIAKVLDAGTTGQGSPFIVMEYVAGHPVTQFCNMNKLAVRRRLELLIKICRAIEHAHQKGVIHRDLKPSNILVGLEDDEPVPKVIDFGVAKAMAPFDGAPLQLTLHLPIIGTPAYMSPEQATEGRRDVDTRSDIFSMGVILFELLTGKTPVEAILKDGEGTSKAFDLLHNGKFLRPSSYFERLSCEEARKTSKERSCSAKRLHAEIHGDLDWVVMTCLDRDRSRRYGNTTDLARDLQRHLEGSPILARPPSWKYRAGRFISKNRVAVCLSSLVIAALLSTTIVSYHSGVQARQARETEKKLRLQAEQDRSLADSKSREARIHQYVANINLAHQAIADGHLSKARQLLRQWIPEYSPTDDIRSFEWWYLMEKCAEDEHISLPLFDSSVDSLSFSPNDDLLAIATREQVSLWSREKGQIISTFPYDGRSVEFSGDGSKLLINGRQGVVVIDLNSKSLLWKQKGYRQQAAFAPDRPVLATSDANGTYLWSTDSWEKLESFPIAVDSLLFSPMPNVLAIQNRDGISILRLGEKTAPIQLEDSSRSSPFRPVFRFSPDGRFLILAKNEDSAQDRYTLAIYDVKTGQKNGLLSPDLPSSGHSGVISGMDVSQGSKQLVTGSWDHSIRIWDFQQGKLVRRLLGHRSEVWSVALSPAGKYVASGSKDGEVRIWPSEIKAQSSTIDGPWEPLDFSKNGTQFTAYHSEGKLTNFELATGSPLDGSTVEDLPSRGRRGIPVDQKDARRIEIREDGMINVIDITDQATATLSTGLRTIDNVQLSLDGRWLTAINVREGLRCWDLNSPENLVVIRNKGITATYSRDSSTLVVTDRDGQISAYEMITGRRTSHFQMVGFPPGSRITLSPDGTLLALTRGYQDYENVISLIDLESGIELGNLKGHKQGIWHLAFSPDGRTLASSGSGGVIRLWNIATKTELLTIDQRGSVISTLTFSPDGRTLIAGSPGFSKNPGLQIFRGLSKKHQ